MKKFDELMHMGVYREAMNEKGAVGIVVAIIVLVAIGAGIFLFVDRGGDEVAEPIGEREETAQDATTVSTGEVLPESSETPFSGTVVDLFERGENLTCTFSREDQSGVAEGVVYVASEGERLRGDFEIDQPDGQTVAAHVIRDGEYSYFWMDGSEQGFKVSVADEDALEVEEETAAQNPQQDLLNETVDYDCQRWPVDPTVFVVPSDREFVDVAEQVQNVQCSACENLEGPARVQCLQALGCEG